MSGAEMVGIMKGTAAGMETGTIEISTNDLDLLFTLLDFVRIKKKGGMAHALFPKDLIAVRSTLTTVLRYEFRDYEIKVLPQALFLKNEELEGELIITKSRAFGAGEKTLRGQSKDGWRFIEFQADAAFMRSIEK